MMFPSLLKLTSQHGFNAVDLGGDVAGRKSGDLCNGSGFKAFEIGEDDLPVDGLETVNQVDKAAERLIPIDGGRTAVGIRDIFQFV